MEYVCYRGLKYIFILCVCDELLCSHTVPAVCVCTHLRGQVMVFVSMCVCLRTFPTLPSQHRVVDVHGLHGSHGDHGITGGGPVSLQDAAVRQRLSCEMGEREGRREEERK